ncbi:uncharacterized protein NPIL_240621 [Nephila pilipes]|uniref:Uncharacterized protein n=1 Tax=Nephila pilipes TaxID=299642 RepID=A0A8X6QDN6_NEPPI|nr:uncharacterized protein NPIL_240621 [Nephila pilipes]
MFKIFFLLISTIFHIIFCQIRTFEQETNREISLLKNPDPTQNENSKLQRKTSKIVQTYHHIVKKILPVDDFDRNLNSDLQNSLIENSLDKNMDFMQSKEEEGSKISFQNLNPRHRFRRRAKQNVTPYLFFKFNNGRNPEGVLKFDRRGIPHVVYYQSYNIETTPNVLTTTVTQVPPTESDQIIQNYPVHRLKSDTSEKYKRFKKIYSETRVVNTSKIVKIPVIPTPVPKSMRDLTTFQESIDVPSEKNNQPISISSILDLQSLIGAMQREIGSTSTVEKRSDDNDERKNPLIIIKPNPGLKIVPEIEYSTESIKLRSKPVRDLPTPIPVVAIWVVSCVSLSAIVVTSFSIYIIKSRKLSKKPLSNMPKSNDREKGIPVHTNLKRDNSSYKVIDSLRDLNNTLEETLSSMEVYEKDILQEAYSRPRHTEMIKGLSKHRIQIQKLLS